MNRNELLQKGERYAETLIQADPLLASIAEKLFKEKTHQSKISGTPITPTLGSVLIEHYIEKLAAAKRIQKENDDLAFENLMKISGLSKDECIFLIQDQLDTWEKYIE